MSRKTSLVKLFRMSTRFDVVVYGATGFTGTFIVERMIKSQFFDDLSIAVAGRNEKKLREVLRIVGEKTGTLKYFFF